MSSPRSQVRGTRMKTALAYGRVARIILVNAIRRDFSSLQKPLLVLESETGPPLPFEILRPAH